MSRSKLEQIFIQTNEHMRATDSKRDRVYYLFILVFGTFLTFYKQLIMSSIVIIVANFFLILFGLTVIFIIINYQIWQVLYVSTAIVLQKIINRNMEDEVNNKLIIELSNEGSTLSPFKLGYGASFFIYNSGSMLFSVGKFSKDNYI